MYRIIDSFENLLITGFRSHSATWPHTVNISAAWVRDGLTAAWSLVAESDSALPHGTKFEQSFQGRARSLQNIMQQG